MKIIILNGPNIDMLHKRHSNIYGNFSLKEIENLIVKEFPTHQFQFFQSNNEGELIEKVHSAETYFDGLIINPGGYAHTSVALKDALEICGLPKVEVHLSNLSVREDFRNVMLTASSCDGYISGFREIGYLAAIYLIERIKAN